LAPIFTTSRAGSSATTVDLAWQGELAQEVGRSLPPRPFVYDRRMSIESERDLIGLKRAGRVVAATLRKLEAAVRPGVATGDLDALCARLLADAGGCAAPKRDYGFPGSLCISVNDEAVHGVPGARVLERGDLVKLDLVAELGGYVADAAVTVAVPLASPAALRLATCARRAFERALPQIRAGARISQIGRAVEREARRSGFTVLRELCGHGVGRAIHEAPDIPNVGGAPGVLTEGLVIAVEPIVGAGGWRTATADDGWTVRTADGSLAAHYEHSLVVTRAQPIVLTA
jgi:methionyl aminopeptidase